jgi:valyl-tRNA synthetase
VDTAQIVGPAIDAVRSGEVQILPEQDKKVYFHWLENIEPWCISRQLWWGHQIPVWYGFDLTPGTFTDAEGDGALDEVELLEILSEQRLAKGDERHHAAADFAHVTNQFADVLAALPQPLNHATVTEVADREAAVHAIAASLAQYNISQDPTHLVYPVWRDADVLDTWFSSGLWPIGTLGWPDATPEMGKYFPTSVLVTGFDIIFFWVARMMMMQYAVVHQKPFSTVYVHALVRDEKGKKMSKSLGNVLDPLELIDEYGADAVRFTLTSMAAMGRDLKLSTQRIAGYRNFGTKLWNACRFAEMNEVFEAAPTDALPTPQATVNRWIVGETARVREEVDAALGAFRFNDAANALYTFVWGKVCDWYLEFSKPLLQGEDAAAAAETRATMRWVLEQCMILLHPIMPFVTEELWGTLSGRDTMLVHADWPGYGADLIDEAADAEMNWVIDLIDSVRSARAQMHVPAGTYVPLVATEIGAQARTAWDNNETLIKRLARIENLATVDTMPKGSAMVTLRGATLGIPLEGIIDFAEERARLEKVLGKLEKELKSLSGRLNNPKFLASAPEDVVEENRARLTEGEDEAARICDALARLAEVG